MERITVNTLRKPGSDRVEPDDRAASKARRHLLKFAHLNELERNRLSQQIAIAEGWKPWPPGGFRFGDGSVLWPSARGWRAFGATEARERLELERKQSLQVRLLHAFLNGDRREKRSVSEAHFEYLENPERWRLVVEYEAYMASPLYGFEAESFLGLLELNLWNLRVNTARSDQRWRLEQISLHPDWRELSKVSSP